MSVVAKENWNVRKIGDLTTVRTGKTPSRKIASNYGGNIPWVKTGEVLDSVIFETEEHLTQEGLDESKCEVFPKESLLIALYGQGLTRGRTAKLGIPATTNQACAVLLPSKNYHTDYVWHFLRASYDRLRDLGRGGNQPNLNLNILREYKIPLPPLPEQKRIAGILDKADSIRRKRQQAIGLTEQFLRSTFLDMFGDPVTNPKGWEVKTMEELGTVDRGKFAPRPRNDPRYYGGDFPFIQTGDLANCEGVLRTWTQTLNEEGTRVSREFPAGTIAIAIAANIGDTAILGFDSYATDSVVGIQIDDSKATAEYVEYWFRFQQKLLKQRAPETAQKNINLQVLRPLPVPVPELSLQKKFAVQYKGFEVRKKHFDEALRKLDDLFNSLVQRAFKGVL